MHLSKNDIAKLEGEEKRHFLNPNAQRSQISLGDATGITGFGFHVVEIQPGKETTELHFHYFEDECLFVLNGEATAIIGDEEFEIGEGDFLGYPKNGAPHSIKNTGNDVLRCIVVGERKENDVVDYPRLNKRLFRNSGVDSYVCDIE